MIAISAAIVARAATKLAETVIMEPRLVVTGGSTSDLPIAMGAQG